MTTKPRDIRELLRGKINPELGKVLLGLAEDHAEIRQMLKELLLMFSKIADMMHVHTLIIEQLKADPRLSSATAAAIANMAGSMSKDHSSIIQSEAIKENDE